MTATPVAQSKLTPELIEHVETSLRVNPNWAAAADYAGITDRTLITYRNRAQAHQERRETTTDPSELSTLDAHPDQPYWEAWRRWLSARSRGELELVAKIRQIGLDGDWRALQALQKAGWPERYSDRVELTGAGGGPVQIEAMKSEAIERAEAALQELGLRADGGENALGSRAGDSEPDA